LSSQYAVERLREKEARNTEQTRNHGIKSKFSALDAVVVQDTHIRGEAVVAVGELNLHRGICENLNANHECATNLGDDFRKSRH
jgi:hypothetical protein